MPTIAIVGGHGQIAQKLTGMLASSGHHVLNIIRNAEHSADILELMGEPLVLDVESATAEQLGEAIRGADVVVFAAGAGPNSGPARKQTVDLGASLLSMEAAKLEGIRRFIQISAMRVDEPVNESADESWKAYHAAKRDADIALRDSGLDWTILRPGRLTNGEPTGRVALGVSPLQNAGSGEISRSDVAAVIGALTDAPNTIGLTLDLVSGDTPIAEAVSAL